MRDDLLDDLGIHLPSARDHHYRFAHELLPYALLQAPDGLLGELVAPTAQSALRTLWNRVGQSVAPYERITPFGLHHEFRRFGDGIPLLIVTLPAAKQPPEAVRVVLTMSGAFRYFTQELTHPDDDGTPAWCFCEWTADGTHVNRGRLPRGSLPELLSAIALLLDVPLGDALAREDASVVAHRTTSALNEAEADLLELDERVCSAKYEGRSAEAEQLARMYWDICRRTRPLADLTTDRAQGLLLEAMCSRPKSVDRLNLLHYALHWAALVHGHDSAQAVAVRALVW